MEKEDQSAWKMLFNEFSKSTGSDDVERIAAQLLSAEDEMQDARYNGDDRAFGYAEQKAIRLRRDLENAKKKGQK